MHLRRRDFFKVGALALLPQGLSLGCKSSQAANRGIQPDGPAKTPSNDWLRDARIASLEVSVENDIGEYKAPLDQFEDQHANVVIIDADLGSYVDDGSFGQRRDLLDTLAQGCHLRGMRAVAYYPALQVLGSEPDDKLISKDHPDWLQVGFDGAKNVVIGGEDAEPGVETAWMCPTSKWVDVLTARTALLAKTPLDGVCFDVPLLSDAVSGWTCTNSSCNDRFHADTGMSKPGSVNWADPVFRRWVEWRHQVLWELEQALAKAGHDARADFQTIVQTLTLDYELATRQALDGASRASPGIVRLWDLDSVSDGTAMRGASPDDWVCLAAMMRHGRGCSSGPSWIVANGHSDDDAELVVALAVTTGNNPLEVRTPAVAPSSADDLRKRFYTWLETQAQLYVHTGANTTAVLYSSSSRDDVDQGAGLGVFMSTNASDPQWWSDTATEAASETTYLAEYRGLCKSLLHVHAPYDVVPASTVTADALARYKLVVAPSPTSLSDDAMQALTTYVEGGGRLLLTGVDAGKFDGVGAQRSTAALIDRFGLTGTAPGAWAEKTRGKGTIVHAALPAGQLYLKSSDADVLTHVTAAADAAGARLGGTAPKELVCDLRRAGDGSLVVLLTNLSGLGTKGDGSFSPTPATFHLSVPDQGKSPTKVTLSSPAKDAADQDVPFTHDAGQISFDVTITSLVQATIALA